MLQDAPLVKKIKLKYESSSFSQNISKSKLIVINLPFKSFAWYLQFTKLITASVTATYKTCFFRQHVDSEYCFNEGYEDQSNAISWDSLAFKLIIDNIGKEKKN